MSVNEEISGIYEFDGFRLDANRRLLLKEGVAVQLTPKVFDTLRVLVEHSSQVISKDALMQEVWGDTIVEETNLTTNISLLRKALGEKRDEHNYIVTIPGEGYRFVAQVRTVRETSFIAPETVSQNGINQGAALKHVPPTGSNWKIYIPAICVLLAAIGAYYFWSRRIQTKAVSAVQIRSLAVLPFKPLVSANRDEALEMGMADTLITRLSGLRETVVRPLSAVRRYTDPEQDALEAGRALQVEAVLDGDIVRAGDRVRVTVRLLRVADGRQLWDGRFDENFTNIFTVQDRVSEQVAGILVAQLNGPEQEQLRKRYTQNAEAYRLYLIGRYLWGKRTKEGFTQSIERYNDALKLDPNYALAYAGIADSYNFLGSAGEMPMSESHPLAKAAATRALEIDDQLAEAHTSLAANIMDYYWDWSSAESHFKRAIALNPNYPVAHHLNSQFLSIMGRLDESVAEAEAARALDPGSPAEIENVALALYRARRYNESIALSQQVLQMDPDFTPAHIQLGLSYTQTGRHAEAIAELQRALTLSGHNPDILGMLGFAYAEANRNVEAQSTLNELKVLAQKQYVPSFDIAGVLIGLRDYDEAFKWLDKACAERVWIMGFIKVEPIFDRLKSDHRYADLVRKIGLPQ